MTTFDLSEHALPLAPTRWRDKEDLFLSLFQRGNLFLTRQTGAFWQLGLREAQQIQHKRSFFSRLFMNDEVFLAPLDS
jgi:hypothetical protein